MTTFAEKPPLLDFYNLRVMRGQKIALDDFSLLIGADEHVAILGPNGCGKSTLIKTITRECYPVVRDEVREHSWMKLLGHETWDVFKLRQHMGIVSNDLMLSCTGEASGREERPVCEMSSGEARRVLIARALVHKPGALLFDEPCNSLDLSAQQSVRQTMRALASSGTAIILVTHELADIVPEIGRVVLMDRGRVVADGPKEDIINVQRLAALFGVGVELTRRDGHYHLW
jgi:iron complex transport system ATP-binding protein